MVKYAVVSKNKATLFNVDECGVCHRDGKVDKSFTTIGRIDEVYQHILEMPSRELKFISQAEMDELPIVYFKHDYKGVAYDLMCARCADAIYDGPSEKRLVA